MRSLKRTRVTVVAAAVLLAATVATALYLGVQTRRQFLEISDKWAGYSNEADRKGALISALRGHLGYGGIIHAFKNYVLRGDKSYRENLTEVLERFDAITTEYLSLQVTAAEREAVEAVIATVDLYRSKLDIADRAAADSWPPERTDELVRVDDTSALEALRTLESIWQSNRAQQTDTLFRAVERGRDLIGIGFFSMALLVIASLALAFAFWTILRQMQEALARLSDELDRRRKLERSEQRLAEVVEQSPASIIVTDTEGHIEYVNGHFEDLSGWSREEVIGKTPKFLQSGDTEDNEYQRMRALHAEGKPWHGILHNVRKDGGSYWIESTILPLRGDDGNVHSLLGIGEDITERLRAREHMVRVQKIEAVGLLAGGIAHDFNSVLTSILGSAHLAALDAEPDSDIAHEIAQIEIGARRAQALVQQLLGFARRKAGNPVPTDLRDIVGQALRLVRAAAGPEIRFEFDAAGVPAWVNADPTHLHQIAMNLLGNASEAIGGQAGVITIAIEDGAEGESDGVSAPKEMVKLTISDDGPGMTEDIRRRVFDAFFTTKPMGKGTGLGLAVVHGLVSDAGGVIEVESARGKGATFTVCLPRGSAPATAGSDSPEAQPYGTERLLLVDDEVEITATLRRSLTRMGYVVEAFSSSLAALRSFETAPDRFDAVISDVVMPELDGYQLAARLRTIRPSVPILFLTGFAPRMKTLDGPEPAIVVKPVDPATLARRLRDHLDQH